MTEEKKPWEKYAEQSSEVKPWEKYSSNQEAEPLKKKDQQQYAGVNQKPSEEESGVSSPEPAPVAEKKSGAKEEGNWFTDGLKNSFLVAPVVDLINKSSEKAKTYQQEKINKAAKSMSSEELAKANPTDIYLNSAAQSGENYSQITKDGKIRPAFDYSTIDDQVDVNDYHKWISNIKKGLETGEAPAPSPMDDLYKQILSQDNEETLGFANKAYLHNQQVIGIKYDNLTKSDENKAVIARAASLREGIKSLGSRNDDDASNQRQRMVDEFSQLSSQYGDVLSEYDNLVAADEKSRKYIQNAYKLNKNGFDAIDRKIESSKSLDKNFDGWNKAGIAIPHAALKLVTSIARIPSTVANTAMGIAGNEDYTWADQWDESLDKIADLAIDEYAPKSINPLGKYIPVDNVSYESSKDINKGLADFDEDGKFSGINTANLGWNLTNTLIDMGIMIGGGAGIGAGIKSLGAGTKLASGAGLVSSSYLVTTPEYYKAAKEAGVPHAKLFAAGAGLLTSSLELINPNIGSIQALSKGGAEIYAKTIAKSLASGKDIKQSFKDGLKFLVKDGLGEQAQEFSQMLGDKAIEGVANYVGNENYFDNNFEKLKGEAAETALLTLFATGIMGSVKSLKTSMAVLPYEEAINMVAKDSDKYMPIVQSMIKNQEIDPESTKRIMEDVNNRKSVIEQYGEETAYIDRVTGNPMTKDQAEQAIIDAPNSVEVFNDEETKILQDEKIAELPKGWKVKSVKQAAPDVGEIKETEQAPVDPKIKANETIRYVREQGIGSEVTEDQIKLLLKDKRAKNNQIGRVTQNITKVMSKLSGEAPRMVMLNSVEDANALAKKLYNKDGVDINGWIDRETNTMFFVPNATTAIHEVVMHPVIDAVKKYKPELYQQFLEDVGNIKGSDGKTFLERSNDLGYKGDKIGEEAIVDFLSQVAGDNFKGGRISVIGAQIADAFRKILSAIGLTDKDLRINLDNPVTLQNFAAQLADAIDKGKTIDFGFDSKATKKETDFSVVGNEPISKGSDQGTTYLEATKDRSEGAYPPISSESMKDMKTNSQWLNLAVTLSSGKFDYNFNGSKVSVDLPVRYKDKNKKLNKLIADKRSVVGSSQQAKEEKARIDNKLSQISSEVIGGFKNAMKDNLRELYSSLTPEFIKRSKEWYHGANRIANDLAKTHNKSVEQVGAILAALSPQTDWFNNISTAKRVLKIMSEHGDTPFDDSIYNSAIQSLSKNPEGKSLKREQVTPFIDRINDVYGSVKGMTINQLLKREGDWKLEAAVVLRSIDHAKNSPKYESVTPEGKTLSELPANIKWNSETEIAKAMSAFVDGSKENISKSLGYGNKVRNFYNNIVDPDSKNGYVTADTHALSAALMAPISAVDAGGFKLFGGGANLVYALVTEAYQEVAKEENMLPRELQSVLWEAHRAGVNNVNRSESQIKATAKLIQEGHEKGTATRELARQIIRANPSDSPAWDRGIRTQKVDYGFTGKVWSEANSKNSNSSDSTGGGNTTGSGGNTSVDSGSTERVNQPSQEEDLPDWVTNGVDLSIAGVHEGVKINYTDNAESFHKAIISAIGNRSEDSLQVTIKSIDDYQSIIDAGGRLYLSEDGNFGAFLDSTGYMGSLFKNPKSNTNGVAKTLQNISIKDGGRWMDAYGTQLEDIYIKNKFRPVARIKFNEEYAPDGWMNTNLRTKPDVVFFALDPSGNYKKGDGKYFEDWDQAVEFVNNFVYENKDKTEAYARRLEEAEKNKQHGNDTKEKLKAQGLTEVANNLPSNFKEPDFSFVGLKASKRLGDASLKEARQMEASGSKPNDIWLKTGWERAADGHWISEIFDPKTARVNKKSLTEKVKIYKNPTYKLPEVLNHPKLFKAYPELRNIDVKLMRLKDGHFGTYHSGQNRIDFDPTKNVDAEKLTGFLLHEVQHTIQEIETQSSGAQGGTSSYWTNIGETVARNVENRLGLSQAERVATPPSSTEDIKRGDQTTSADMVNKIMKGFNTMISNGDLTAIDALTILKAAKYNTNHPFYAPLRKMAKDEARSLALRVKDDSVSFSQQTETTRRVVEPDTTINQALRSELLNNPNDPKFTYNEQKIKATLDAWKNMSAADIANDMSRFKPSDLLAFLRDVDGTNNLSALGFIEIFKKATAEGNDNLAFDAFEALNKIGSGAGQLLRQMRELSSAVMSPNAPRAQRIGANRGIVKTIVTKFFEKNNFVLTAEMKVEIDNLINNYVTAMANEQDAHKTYTASGLKADEARWRDATKQTNDALASMEDFMSNNVPQDLGDLISTLIKGNLLTASSVVVNTTSNLTNAALTGLVEGQAVPIVRGATRMMTGAKGSGFVGSSVAAAYAAHTFAKNIGPAFREAFKRGGMRPRDMNKFEVMRHIHPYQALTQLFRSAVNKASGKDVYKTGTLPKKWDATSSPLSAKAYTPVSVVVGKTAEGLFGWPAALMFRLLHATDKPFKEAARIFAATQALSAEKNGAKPTIEEVMNYIDNATPEQAEKIDGYADQFAYSDPNSIAAKAGNRFVGLPNYIAEMLDKENLGGVGRTTSSFLKLLGTSVQPYVTVPSNVMSHFIELVMPPVAVAGAVKNYRNGNREQGDQMIGRAIVGSTFYMAAGTLYTLGLVMAGDDDDKTGDKALKNMLGGSKSLNMSGLIRLSTGGDPSFKQGDKTVALSKLGIFGLFTDFQARWAEEMKDKGVWNDNYWDTMISQHWGEALGAYYPAFFKSSLDLSFFTGQLELFDSIKASGRDDGNGWNRFTTGLFDTASNLVWANQYSQIAQGIAAENGDRPNMLRAQSDSWTGLMYEKFGKKMPWIDAESDLAPVLDLWGKPVKNSFLEINDPFKIRTVSDETSMDIWKLMTKTGAGNPVSIPTKNISLDGNTYSLDEADYLSLQAISGEFRKSYINEIMNTEEYRIANDAEKIQMIKEISKEANNDAKSAFEDQWAEQVNNGDIVIENGQYRYVKTGRVGKAR